MLFVLFAIIDLIDPIESVFTLQIASSDLPTLNINLSAEYVTYHKH